VPDFSDAAEVPRSRKNVLRAELLAQRRSLSAEVRAAAARQLQTELTELVRRLRPRRMTGYVPVGSEPGGPELPDVLLAALGPDGEFLLPVLLPDLDLDWARYPGAGSLTVAGRGLREPTGDRLGPAAVAGADLMVVPALAVDPRGVRLGRGGGSYDRALARTGPATLTVALLYDNELVESVPAQPHDRTVGAVITPGGGFRPLSPG
jgi:5-formyltetrahydrofolate cyclo-ligase